MELLFDQTLKVINLILQTNWFVFLIISDKVKVNQVCFIMYQRNYGNDEIFACKHPIIHPAQVPRWPSNFVPGVKTRFKEFNDEI